MTDLRRLLESDRTRLAAVCDRERPDCRVTALAAGDGPEVTAAYADGRVVVWDVLAARPVREATSGSPGPPLALSARGATALIARGPRLAVLDTASGVTLQELGPLAAPVTIAALSADGSLAFGAAVTRHEPAAGEEGEELEDGEEPAVRVEVDARVWRVATGEPVAGAVTRAAVQTIVGAEGRASAAFAPDGALLAFPGTASAVSPDGTLAARVGGGSLGIGPAAGRGRTDVLDGGASELTAVAFADAASLVVGTADGLVLRVVLRDPSTGLPRARCPRVPAGLDAAALRRLGEAVAAEARGAESPEGRRRAVVELGRLWPEGRRELARTGLLRLEPPPPPERWATIDSPERAFVTDTAPLEEALATGEPLRWVADAARALVFVVPYADEETRGRLVALLRRRIVDRRVPPLETSPVGVLVSTALKQALDEAATLHTRWTADVTPSWIRAEVLAAIDAALERGLRLIDVADLVTRPWTRHGLGSAEDLCRHLLARLEDPTRSARARFAVLRGDIKADLGALDMVLRVPGTGAPPDLAERVRADVRRAVARALADPGTPDELRVLLTRDLPPRWA